MNPDEYLTEFFIELERLVDSQSRSDSELHESEST